MDKKPIKGEYLEVLLRSSKTIFSTKDVALLWGETKETTITSRLNKYVKAGKLVRVRRGLYAKDKSYNRLEFATRIYTPAYVSLETVLKKEGMIFQYYETIFVISYLTREIICDSQKYSFKKIKDPTLSNSAGIEHKEGYAIASLERAFLDTMYINKDYYFDNLLPLNWDKVFEILPIYNNQRMLKKVKKIYKKFKEEQ